MDKNNQRAAHPDGPKPLYGMSIEGACTPTIHFSRIESRD